MIFKANFGITGGIGSGKSHARMSLKALGFETLDVDLLTYRLYDPYNLENADLYSGDGLYKALIKQFGKEIINKSSPNHQIDPVRLRDVCICNDKQMFIVSGILKEHLTEELEHIIKSKPQMFIEAPMLYEYKWENMFSKIIVIAADYELRVERLMNKKRISRDVAEYWVSCQMPQEEKIKVADKVIWNNEEISFGKEFTLEDPLFVKMKKYIQEERL